MHFSTSVFQQSWRNMFPCFTSEKVYTRLLMEALRTYTTLPSHHPHPWTRSYPTTKILASASSWGGMCKQSLAGDALVSLRCQCFGRMIATCLGLWRRSSCRTLQEGSGLGTARIVLVAAHCWLVVLFSWTIGISGGWKWKCRSPAPTSVCTSWVNTCLDTTWHNAGSNCWLQFALVSA